MAFKDRVAALEKAIRGASDGAACIACPSSATIHAGDQVPTCHVCGRPPRVLTIRYDPAATSIEEENGTEADKGNEADADAKPGPEVRVYIPRNERDRSDSNKEPAR